MKTTEPDFVPEREDYIKRELLADMEREIYVDRMIVTYSGVFKFKELLELVETWCNQKGYYKEVVNQKHKLSKTGKSSSVTFQLHRKITQLHVSVIDISLSGLHMTDIEEDIDGKIMDLNEGDVEIVFNGFLMTHIKHRWESRPKFALIRKMIDKYVYKLDRPSLAGTVVSDASDLANKLRSSMMVYQHRLEAKKAMEEAEEFLEGEETPREGVGELKPDEKLISHEQGSS